MPLIDFTGALGPFGQLYSLFAGDSSSNAAAGWCASTGLCPSSAVKASEAYLNPDLYFSPPSAPPAVGAPANLTTPPASGADAQRTVDAVLADQMTRWQGQNTADFAAMSAPGDNSTLYAWLAAGAAAAAVLLILRR